MPATGLHSAWHGTATRGRCPHPYPTGVSAPGRTGCQDSWVLSSALGSVGELGGEEPGCLNSSISCIRVEFRLGVGLGTRAPRFHPAPPQRGEWGLVN